MAVAEVVGTQMGRLAGQVALVTGAAKGLGAAISASLKAQGASLALCGRDESALEHHALMIDAKGTGKKSLAIACDVLDEHSVGQMVAATVEQFGGLDIL